MKSFLTLLLFIFCLRVEAKKYAVIVNGSDPSNLDGQFDILSNQAEKIYKKQGFEIIKIDADEGGTAAMLKEKLSNLTDVDKLSFSFFTHGSVRASDKDFTPSEPLSSDQLPRFPISHLRSDEIKTQYGAEQIGDSIRFAYAMLTGPSARDWIGLGDLHDTIASLKKIYPKMVTTISSLSCFGGNAIRALDDIPDVQVLASAPGNQAALSMQPSVKEGMVDYSTLYLQHIDKGLTPLDAHLKAREDYLSFNLKYIELNRRPQLKDSYGHYLVRPQSSMELYFSDLCLGGPSSTEINRCEFDQSSSEVTKLASTVTRIGVFNFLKTYIDSEKRYLSTMSSSYSCQNESRILPDPAPYLKRAKEQVRNMYQKAPTDNKSIARLWETKILEIQSKKTGRDLVPFIKFPAERVPLVSENLSKENLEEIKGNMSFGFSMLLSESKDEDFLKLVNDHLSKMKSDKDLSLCTPKECDVESILMGWVIADHFPFEHTNMLENAREVGADKLSELCSARLSFQDPSQAARARENQITCIEKWGENDPLTALAMFNALKDGDEFSKLQVSFCQQLAFEKDRNEKLTSCLNNLDTLGNDIFWQKMLNLMSIGLSN